MFLYSSTNDECGSDEPLLLQLDLDRLKQSATSARHLPCTGAHGLTRERGTRSSSSSSKSLTATYTTRRWPAPSSPALPTSRMPRGTVGRRRARSRRFAMTSRSEHTKAALSEIVSIVVQFASLKFDSIASLGPDGRVSLDAFASMGEAGSEESSELILTDPGPDG